MCFRARNRTGRRTAVRNQCPSGALVSPREIPAGSKESGNLAEVRYIVKNAPFGAILCAARSQRCGWVKTHPYITTRRKGFFRKLQISIGSKNYKIRKDTLCRYNNFRGGMLCGG